MHYDSLAPDLKAWLQDNVARGCEREQLLQSLRAAGYQPKFAREAVALALAHRPPAPAPAPLAAAEARTAAVFAPATPTLATTPNAFATSDRSVHLLFALDAPRVLLFDGLLAPEECDELIELSRARLQRSTVVNAVTGDYDVHPDRTSRGTHFQRGENALVRKIERRIGELVGCPVEQGEPLQILHYLPGAEYKPHYDFFDPDFEGNDKVLAMGGQRIATLVMYLSDVGAGGATTFPDLGLAVAPRKGNAVYFAYADDAGALDRRTLHGGAPVADGEKWIATKWIRERAYAGSRA